MGLFRWCHIQSKLIELVEGRPLVCRIVERRRGSVQSLCLGKDNCSWSVATMEELVLEEGTEAFWRRSQVGLPALLAQ
jgi:hypothetical protein